MLHRNPQMESVNQPQLLAAHLLFAQLPNVSAARLGAQLRQRFAQVDHAADSLVFFFPDLAATYADGRQAPVSLMVTEAHAIPDNQPLAAACAQSWHWPQAEAAVAACGYQVVVTDFMARALELPQRLGFFQRALDAVLAELQPQAIYFLSSQKLVEPRAYQARGQAVLDGLMNVRFFNVAGSASEEMFMDTLGLHALGLPDFQVRFRELDPGRVAGALTGYAYYLLEHGPVVEDGNTIQGLTPQQKWTCYYADAAVDPAREVIDLETD